MLNFNHKKSLFIFLFGFSIILLIDTDQLFSQDILSSKIKWTINTQFYNPKDSSARSYESYFITYGKDQIEWFIFRTDVSGEITSKKNVLTVNKVEGVWEDISRAGEVSYSVTMNKSAGTLNFKKVDNSILIKILLIGNSGGKMDRSFEVINAIKQ